MGHWYHWIIQIVCLSVAAWAIAKSRQRGRLLASVQQELEESERKFDTAFQAIPDAVVITRESDGELLLVNEGFSRIMGYSPEQIRNLKTTDIAWLTIEDRQKMVAAIRERGQVRNYRARVRNGRSELIDIVIHCSQVKIGNQDCLLAVVQDITEELRAELALAASQRKFEALFNSSEIGMLLSRFSDGMIIEVNRGFEKITGLQREKLIGRTTVEVGMVSQGERQVWIEKLLDSGTIREVVVDRKRRDGTRVVVSCSLDLIKLDGEQYSFLSVQNITERMKAEEALVVSDRMFQTLFQLNPAALSFAHAKTGLLVDVNQAFEKIHGISRQEAIGKTALELGIYPDPAVRDRLLEKLLAEKRLTGVEIRRKRKDGSTMYVSGNAELLEMDGDQYLISASLDITPMKEAESLLRKTNATLEARVVQRTNQLEQANEELEAFCYSVSHDLRAPLRSIDGFSRAIEEDYAAKLDSQAQDYLKRIRRAAQRMSELIDDLLDLSRVARAELSRAAVCLSDIVQEVIAGLRHEDPNRIVDVTIEPDIWVQADPSLIHLVIENLVSNAWKYSSRRKNSHIEFGREIGNNQIVYFVRDNGVGFDPAYASKLFKPFQRLHSEVDFPGNGIGLATVMRIVKRHGGDVWAQGAIDQGATFRFTLANPNDSGVGDSIASDTIASDTVASIEDKPVD